MFLCIKKYVCVVFCVILLKSLPSYAILSHILTKQEVRVLWVLKSGGTGTARSFQNGMAHLSMAGAKGLS
jgi:hypothetical protein